MLNKNIRVTLCGSGVRFLPELKLQGILYPYTPTNVKDTLVNDPAGTEVGFADTANLNTGNE